MDDMKKAMRLSLKFGLPGALMVPVSFEVYANISQWAAFIMLGAWVIFIGLKFYRLPIKPALVGISAFIAYTVILGFALMPTIHTSVKSYLEKNSKYFQLDLQQSAVFWLYAVLIFFLLFLFSAARAAVDKIRANNEKSAEYIDNAFSKDDENDI
ncbi:MAG: hypothetical protein IJ571_01540 [Ruminococcus sp.]|nr:hypothetical protein [Ruminococcus sp.]